MHDSQHKTSASLIMAGVVVLAVAAITAAVFYASRMTSMRPGLEEVFTKTLRKNQLVSSMRIGLHASVEAEKSAVLAETDEASQQFADQASRAAAEVEQARSELERLIKSENIQKEMDLLRQFNSCWERFQEIDRTLLPLAVQNTNLKALGLSFGPASEAVRRMELALAQLIDSNVSSVEPSRIVRESLEALTAAIKIYASQAPHIAEVDDTKMDEIEATMSGYDQEVNAALHALGGLTNAAGKSALDAARAAYAEFARINSEVIRLSRENSNVRSLALSLGQKRKVTAQCDEVLSTLHDTLQDTRFKATR